MQATAPRGRTLLPSLGFALARIKSLPCGPLVVSVSVVVLVVLVVAV
jgi:hypothetical protein